MTKRNTTGYANGQPRKRRAIKMTRYTVGYSGITQKYSVWDADKAELIARFDTESEADDLAAKLHHDLDVAAKMFREKYRIQD